MTHLLQGSTVALQWLALLDSVDVIYRNRPLFRGDRPLDTERYAATSSNAVASLRASGNALNER